MVTPAATAVAPTAVVQPQAMMIAIIGKILLTLLDLQDHPE